VHERAALLETIVFFAAVNVLYLTRLTRRYFTMEVMRDPVIALDGFTWTALLSSSFSVLPNLCTCFAGASRCSVHCADFCWRSYERASIEAWFASGKTTSPKTGADLGSERIR
jgi:hypothetical protein